MSSLLWLPEVYSYDESRQHNDLFSSFAEVKAVMVIRIELLLLPVSVSKSVPKAMLDRFLNWIIPNLSPVFYVFVHNHLNIDQLGFDMAYLFQQLNS